jgi:hypothetical protein
MRWEKVLLILGDERMTRLASTDALFHATIGLAGRILTMVEQVAGEPVARMCAEQLAAEMSRGEAEAAVARVTAQQLPMLDRDPVIFGEAVIGLAAELRKDGAD